ncbi:hypothetical protein OG21DRAFT_839423 [Imleria badia]|nr:hypothetical protein OG21DRAFT_839423 [Imleria badia]
MIRTWVIWKDSRLVHTVLLVFALGHWIVLALDAANLQAIGKNDCIIDITHPALNAAVFVYSLCYDFLVLVLSIVGLSRQSSKSPLMKRLRAQGLVYFMVAVVTYIVPTVFAFLGVNREIDSLWELPIIKMYTSSGDHDWSCW